jgi:phosphoglycolate phosphatase-like HAD superfamily hydrolase
MGVIKELRPIIDERYYTGVEWTRDYSDYIKPRTEETNITLETSDPEHIEVEGLKARFFYPKDKFPEGVNKEVKLRFEDTETGESEEYDINVRARPKPEHVQVGFYVWHPEEIEDCLNREDLFNNVDVFIILNRFTDEYILEHRKNDERRNQVGELKALIKALKARGKKVYIYGDTVNPSWVRMKPKDGTAYDQTVLEDGTTTDQPDFASEGLIEDAKNHASILAEVYDIDGILLDEPQLFYEEVAGSEDIRERIKQASYSDAARKAFEDFISKLEPEIIERIKEENPDGIELPIAADILDETSNYWDFVKAIQPDNRYTEEKIVTGAVWQHFKQELILNYTRALRDGAKEVNPDIEILSVMNDGGLSPDKAMLQNDGVGRDIYYSGIASKIFDHSIVVDEGRKRGRKTFITPATHPTLLNKRLGICGDIILSYMTGGDPYLWNYKWLTQSPETYQEDTSRLGPVEECIRLIKELPYPEKEISKNTPVLFYNIHQERYMPTSSLYVPAQIDYGRPFSLREHPETTISHLIVKSYATLEDFINLPEDQRPEVVVFATKGFLKKEYMELIKKIIDPEPDKEQDRVPWTNRTFVFMKGNAYQPGDMFWRDEYGRPANMLLSEFFDFDTASLPIATPYGTGIIVKDCVKNIIKAILVENNDVYNTIEGIPIPQDVLPLGELPGETIDQELDKSLDGIPNETLVEIVNKVIEKLDTGSRKRLLEIIGEIPYLMPYQHRWHSQVTIDASLNENVTNVIDIARTILQDAPVIRSFRYKEANTIYFVRKVWQLYSSISETYGHGNAQTCISAGDKRHDSALPI